MHCVEDALTPFEPTSTEKIASLTELNTKLTQKASEINKKLREMNTKEAQEMAEQVDESTEKLMEDRNRLMSLQGALDNNNLVMNSNYYKFIGWSTASILILFLAYKQFSKK